MPGQLAGKLRRFFPRRRNFLLSPRRLHGLIRVSHALLGSLHVEDRGPHLLHDLPLLVGGPTGLLGRLPQFLRGGPRALRGFSEPLVRASGLLGGVPQFLGRRSPPLGILPQLLLVLPQTLGRAANLLRGEALLLGFGASGLGLLAAGFSKFPLSFGLVGLGRNHESASSRQLWARW